MKQLRILSALLLLLGSAELAGAETYTRDGNGATGCGVSTAAVTTPINMRIDPASGGPVSVGRPGTAFQCVLTTTATTSTQVTGCEVVAGKSYYITDIIVSGDAANAVSTPWILQSGTSTACTGPAILIAGYHAALTTVTHSFATPLKTTAAHGLCILDGTAGTKKITVSGYLAP